VTPLAVVVPARLAVVVPAHDEQDLLPACLRSIAVAAEQVAPVAVEVIVVADACTDDTPALAAAAGATVLSTAARNVGRARGAGLGHALRAGPDGLWLATTDADSRVPPNWLRWHLQHAEAGADLVAGAVVVEDWSGWPAGLPALYEQRYRAATAHAHGANLGVSAGAYRAAGGVPPIRHSEDQALIDRVRRAGGHVVTDDRCPVVTSARRSGRAPHGFAAHLTALAALTSSQQPGCG
jgi:glycosyltransferase involved in cell wall biosynthesis